MSIKIILKCCVILAVTLIFQHAVLAQPSKPVDLDAIFASPPDSAKPHTWWHWMNGNVSKAGITLDLEAMKRVGIGGAHLAQVGTGIPKGPVPYDSPEMVDMVQFAFKEADRLGLDLCLFNCPGWSSSGGPWITPENSMKMLSYTETPVMAGQKVSIALAQPTAQLNFYRDSMVLAFPGTSTDGRISNWAALSGTGRGRGATPAPSASIPAQAGTPAIDPAKVIDLSKNMDANGQLTWTAPAGNWMVLRIGFTTNGVTNKPGPDGGVGLEVDKFSREALDIHFNAFFGKYYDVMKPLAARGKMAALIDSYETGLQNWTDQFPQEFKRRRGYDILPYMPAMATGRVVSSLDISQRFLWDVRKTQAELMSENYYAHFTELCHQHGMQSYFEPYDTSNFDEMVAGITADMPMGEFWQMQDNQRSIKLVASVMHMNGRPIMGAESFTSQSRWTEYPYSLKALGDFMWTQGLNKFVFHRYAMQPNANSNVMPGMTMGPWGGHFDRTNTWFDHGMAAWLQYVRRSQALLQQGLFVGDLVYFAGEDSPVRNIEQSKLEPTPPPGHGFDTIDAVTLSKRVKIVDGKITLPDGLTYRVLVLPPILKTMSLSTLQNIHDLVSDGMTLVVNSPKPTKTPSLSGYPAADGQVEKLAADLWGNLDGSANTEHACGKGNVFWGVPLVSVLEQKLGVKQDCELTCREGTPEVHYIHKHVGDNDVYFVANRTQNAVDLVCTFNVNGKQPELWDPVTGQKSLASVYDFVDGRTRMPLQLEPSGSVFVVFRSPAPTRHIDSVLKDGQVILSAEQMPCKPQMMWPPPTPPRPSGTPFPKQFAMIMPKPQDPPAIELIGGPGNTLLAWQNGAYAMHDNQNKMIGVRVTDISQPMEITGSWNVAFPPNLGAPSQIALNQLMSLTEHPDKGVKYFSGTATYTKKFNLAADATADGKRLFLDLGRVQVVAEVLVNGKNLGYLWNIPFRVDISDAVHTGDNDLEVRVTDLWANRLIGDEQLPADNQYNAATVGPATLNAITALPDWYIKGLPKPPSARITFTTWHHWTADSPLVDSGLIGPVLLRNAMPIPLEP